MTNFLIFAVTSEEESDPGTVRYVNFMWPGFVGVDSGFSEHGIAVFMNDGTSRSAGPQQQGASVDDWVLRDVLVRARTLSEVPEILDSHRTEQGGVCGDGCNWVFSQPTLASQHDGGMIYEGDRFGGAFRHAGEAAPALADAVMATNHFLKYGFNPWQNAGNRGTPSRNFGSEVISFSSLWRYEEGRRTLESWAEVCSASAAPGVVRSPLAIGTARMRELLQRICEGATEYSIVVRPDAMTFDVATASPHGAGWNAPYERWTTHAFADMFQLETAMDV